jgi:hypothetical protein
MAVLERPCVQEIERAVRQILESGEPIDFPELERGVEELLPRLPSRLLVRQAAWRMVNANQAEITSGMRIRKRADQ